MNKRQKAIKSVIKTFDRICVLTNYGIPFNYLTRRRYIKQVFKERGILSTNDIHLNRGRLKKLIVYMEEYCKSN